MPANHKVSVGWQIVFTFIGILNLWAFYRIRKLRKYLLYVVAPSVVVSVVLVLYLIGSTGTARQSDSLNPADQWFPYSEEQLPFVVLSYAANFALQGFSVYLVIVWSREHNRKFDQPAVQPADRPPK
ncbi:MAG TPA: hypothetical protein VF172_11390 [Nitrososphaera sp.]